MWFKKKTELEKQIHSYNQDLEILLQFAQHAQKPSLQEITLEDIKRFYTELVAPLNSTHYRLRYMKVLRKFFRYYRGNNIIPANQILDNPLQTVVENATIEVMQKEEKRKRGRPANVEMIKKVKVLREQAKLSFRKIGAAIGKDSKQAHMWYEASKTL